MLYFPFCDKLSDASPKYNIRACKKIYIISEKDAPANKNRRAGPSCAAVCTRKTDSLLALLVFQLLFFGNVGFHLGLCPALQIGLALPGNAQRLRGHVLGDGAAGGGVGTIAHLHGGHKVRVAADEAVIADLGAELILAVVVAGDGAAAEVAVLAHIAVADVGQVAHRVAPGKVGVLGLHVCTQMHAVVGDGVHPHMGEGADVVVRADVAAVYLTGVDGAALVYDAVLNEIFMAWHYARYVERMAQTARFIYNVPLYVNAAMNSRERKPGEYPSAGPLAHLIDVWHCGAPNIDILAPDLYDDGFTDWVAQYKLHNNPLFIPEIRLTDNNGVRAFYIFGEHDAIGISPFSIEDGSDSSCSPLAQSYTKLKELMPLLTEYQGKGIMKGLLFSQKYKERIITDDDLSITCRHYFTLPWDSRATDGSTWPEGGGLILKLSKNEYIVAGSGIVLEFAKTSEKPGSKIRKQLGEDGFALSNEQIKTKKEKFQGMRCGIGHVDEVEVDKEGKFRYIRRLNGDQDHQGRHVRISVGEFKILYVQLYEYQ